MVQVQVRIQKPSHHQMVLLDVAGEGLFLLLARNARVNQNSVSGIVA